MPYDDTELRILLQGVVAHQETAFTRLYGLTSDRVAAYLCRLLRDQDIVEDLVIDTYVELWRNAHKFDGRSAVSTWILGIARNLAMNWLKRRKTYVSLDDVETPADEQPPDDDSDRRVVSAGLAALPVHHREILALALLRELSYEEIGALLSIPVNTVKSRVFYAKAALRERLQAMGITQGDVL
jgi:RNA polymerase sigma-70 factor (ECF subfamily)